MVKTLRNLETNSIFALSPSFGFADSDSQKNQVGESLEMTC